jgi:hypothetical protein
MACENWPNTPHADVTGCCHAVSLIGLAWQSTAEIPDYPEASAVGGTPTQKKSLVALFALEPANMISLLPCEVTMNSCP